MWPRLFQKLLGMRLSTVDFSKRSIALRRAAIIQKEVCASFLFKTFARLLSRTSETLFKNP